MSRSLYELAKTKIVPIGFVTLFFCGLTLAFGRQGKDRYKLYKLHIPKHARTEAATFSPDGSTLALVQRQDLKPLPEPESEYDLIVLDYRAGKVLAKRAILFITDPTYGAPNPRELFYFDGGKELLYCGNYSLLIFKATDYTQTARIQVGEPLDGKGKRTQIDHCALSADGSDLAVELRQFSGHPFVRMGVGSGFHLDEKSPITIRVFDLLRRKQTAEWTFPTEDEVDVEGFAVAPDGGEIAWTIGGYRQSLPRRVKNLYFLNVRTGKLLGVHSDRSEGKIAFASNQRLLSITSNPAFRDTSHEGIRTWNPRTGALLSEIKSAPNGVHHSLQVSGNQKIILGYIGKDKANENFVNVDALGFRLWDADTGQVLFTSPIQQYQVPRGYATPLPPQYTLSPNGHLVVRWAPDWPDVLVYEVLVQAATAEPRQTP